MSRYSDERRMAVVAKLLPPYNLSVAEVASQVFSLPMHPYMTEADRLKVVKVLLT